MREQVPMVNVPQEIVEGMAENKQVKTAFGLLKLLPPEEALIFVSQICLDYTYDELSDACKLITGHSQRTMRRIKIEAIKKMQGML